MKKVVTFIILCCSIFPEMIAQSQMDSVLKQIATNNKTIQANKQYLEVQKQQYRTGLTPDNPFLEYDYLKGSPAGAGNQTDFTIGQSFDFPTAYAKKSQLSKEQISRAEIDFTAKKQDILLEAKETCINLIYYGKLREQLKARREQNEKLLRGFQLKLDKGEGNLLDVNKARIQLLEIKKEEQEAISAISVLTSKLISLNGGAAINFSDTVYEELPILPLFEKLEADFEANDPERRILEQEKAIVQKQLELSRSMKMPKLELGYHYQGILGQTYSGIHTGISIPLWQNRNTVNVQQSKLVLSDLEIVRHKSEHYYQIKVLYDQYINLKDILEEYRQIFSSLNSTALLDKSLTLGQISTVEYFMEANYYYNAKKNFLLVEKEFNEVISRLYKYKL